MEPEAYLLRQRLVNLAFRRFPQLRRRMRRLRLLCGERASGFRIAPGKEADLGLRSRPALGEDFKAFRHFHEQLLALDEPVIFMGVPRIDQPHEHRSHGVNPKAHLLRQRLINFTLCRFLQHALAPFAYF